MAQKRNLSALNSIARRELGKRRPALGTVKPCSLCGKPIKLVEKYDMEYLLQTGDLVKSGTTWIHAGPEELARCRRARGL